MTQATTRPLALRRDSAVPGSLVVGASAAMQQVHALASRAAISDAKVLITGESGVGKDLVAQFIHANSLRAHRPFVPVNCGAVTESLLGTELFGHAKGSFTGAYRDKVGRLELAHQGTIFLDEVGEMSLQMQAHLLRFLENGEVQRVGLERDRRQIDARVISATNRNLNELLAEGKFRSDLLYRLKVVHIHVPALRDRREDLPALIDQAVLRTGRVVRFTDRAIQALKRHRWPGNVRELQNVIEQVAWMSDLTDIDFDDLPEPIRLAATDGLLPKRERRRQLADDLYATLTDGHYSFWGHVHPLLLKRDITRHDLRQLLRRGLATTRGNYRAMLKLFGMPESDYNRFMNFLAAHDCTVDFREFRTSWRGCDRARIGTASVRAARVRAPETTVARFAEGRRRARVLHLPGSFLDPILKNPRASWALLNARNGSVLASRVEPAFESASRRKGLLGRHSLDNETAIILAPCNSIHTFFMHFSIDVAFVARDGRLLSIYGSVPAWRIRIGLRAFAVVELAAGTLTRVETRAGDVLRLSSSEPPRTERAV